MAKSFAVRLVLVMVLSLMSVVSVSVHASQGKLPPQFSADKDYHTNVAKAREMLQARSNYQVTNIKASVQEGKKYLEVKAYKGASEYEIKLDYPNLKIVKENKIAK